MSRQKTAAGTRFKHGEWTRLYAEMQAMDERLLKLEEHIFDESCQMFLSRSKDILAAARIIAQVDVSASFASYACEYGHVKPTMTDMIEFEARGSSNYVFIFALIGHPVVEKFQIQRSRSFIKNNIHLTNENRIWLLTGPNMGGKSTFLRQTALLSILAQTGGFVPAEHAVLGIVDRY